MMIIRKFCNLFSKFFNNNKLNINNNNNNIYINKNNNIKNILKNKQKIK